VVVIDQLAQFMGVRATEIFFEPLQFHLELADLLEQMSLLGLNTYVSLVFLPLVNSSLASSSSCRFHWLTWLANK
jgi:hypothetical protein